MKLVEELMRLWGYSEDEALVLIKRYKIVDEIENLEKAVSLKSIVVDACQLL